MIDVIGKLNELRLERNLSVYRLAELSGLNQSTLANTFSRGTMPSIANLDAMCQAMGLTLTQFFSDREHTIKLTEDELLLIENYRRLPPNVKKAFAQMANACKENSQL